MIHRHLQVPPGIPLEELPLAAIVDLLERGDLDDWQPIAAAIARDPDGPLAGQVMRLVDTYPMYGTSPLWRSWIDRCRARAEGEGARRSLKGLSALRKELDLTQVELAERAFMSQSDLSKLERRKDMRLSTLETYAEALGGRIRILFESENRSVEIRLIGRASEGRNRGQ